MAENKSLAHPDWPYAGTAHEWRGFVKAKEPQPIGYEFISDKEARRPDGIMRTVYQKQNFGPNLD